MRTTPNEATRQPLFPRGVIIGAAALLTVSIGLAGVARLTNTNHVLMPPTYPVATRDLAFTDLANGGIDITDAKTGRLVSTVAPETGGFVRGIMRGLVRDHRLQGKAAHSAFRLTRWAVVYRGSGDARELRARGVRLDQREGLRPVSRGPGLGRIRQNAGRTEIDTAP